MDNQEPIVSNLTEAVQAYKVPESGRQLLAQSPPMLISGASSVGKNTVADKITKESNYQRVVTHTTRSAREQEVDGVNYWFTTDVEMRRLLDSNQFIEVQLVHQESLYGTTISAYQSVVRFGGRPLLVVDIYGLIKYLQDAPQSLAFFLLPPSFQEWMRRFESRGQVGTDEQKRRLHYAKTEIEVALQTKGVQLLVNDNLNSVAVSALQGKSTLEVQAQNRQLAQQLLKDLAAY